MLRPCTLLYGLGLTLALLLGVALLVGMAVGEGQPREDLTWPPHAVPHGRLVEVR